MKRIPLLFLACIFCVGSRAAEVGSPEEFMRANFHWTIKGIDAGLGPFGDFRRFACFDDRLLPPQTQAEIQKRRWASPCNSVRSGGEDLAAMLWVTWVNKLNAKPVTADEYAASVARIMANNASGDAEPQCAKSAGSVGGRPADFYDCRMVLPFGTYFASFVRFEHKGVDYYVRAQNASSRPLEKGPREAIERIAARIVFED